MNKNKKREINNALGIIETGKEEKPFKKMRKFKEILTYLWTGLLAGLNIIVVGVLYYFREEYFDFGINFLNSLELGFLVLKMGLLLGVLIVDLKTFHSVLRQWRKFTFVKKEEKREGEEEFKRIGFIRKMWFYWRGYEARSWMDKYHGVFTKLQKSIGKIKGTETKELKKMKEEMIKGILVWKDDFQITKMINGKMTDAPVDAEFLRGLYLDELYERYLLKCVDSAERFVNGVSSYERMERI